MSYEFNPFTGKLDKVSPPGGSDTQVQYNKAGVLAGESTFTYNDGSDLLNVGNLTASANIATNTCFVSSLTASRAVVSSAFDQLTSSATTATEIGYVSGVTSSIQTQLNAKGDITAVGNVASGAAFDGSQDSYLLTFLRSAATGTLEWNGTDSYFKFNNSGTNAVTMIAGNPSTELAAILALFNSLDITAAGYTSDNNGIVFAESKSNLIGQGSIFAGLFNDGANPVAGDAFVTFAGGAYSSVGGGTLPTTAHIQIRTPANWSGTSTPGEIAFATMNVGEVDPLAPTDKIVFRCDGTMDFIGDPAKPIGKLTWDNSDNIYAVPKNLLSLEAASDGTSFVVGTPSPVLNSFLDIFTTLGSVSVEGVSGELGTILIESKTGLADLGALLLTGAYTDTGLYPTTDQALFNNIVFGGDGAGGILTASVMTVVSTEDWSTGFSGTKTSLNVVVTGTTDQEPLLILSGTNGTTINFNNRPEFDFVVKSSGSNILEVDSSADALGFFGVAPVVRQTGGVAAAGAAYTATEQGMINRMYTALRNYGLLT
jgi:hypothetical protein